MRWRPTSPGPSRPVGRPRTRAPEGPILVIASASNPFSRYYAEILRAEGLNEFTVTDISNVSAGVLSGYDVAILGDIALTAGQVTMLSDWVDGGRQPDRDAAGQAARFACWG